MTILNERDQSTLLTSQLINYCPQGLDDYKLHGTSDDGCTLCSELKLLEMLKAEVTRKIAQLRVQINQSHSTINCQLPPEMLATIFQAVVEDPSYHDPSYTADSPVTYRPTPLLLGAVCRTWRDIAWSTPRLWASITIHLDFRQDGPTMQKTLTEEWLARAGQLPLSIRLVDDLRYRHDDIHLLRPIIDLINQYSPRWQNLLIDLPTCTFPWFAPVGNQAPLLEYMKVEERYHHLNSDVMGRDEPDVLNLGTTPSLKYLNLRRIALHKLKFDWSALIHFSGEGISDCESLEVLRRAPLLEYGEFHTVSESTSSTELPSDPVIAAHLREIALVFPNRNGTFFMDNLSCPTLESLDVVGPPAGRLSPFFHRSDFTLKSLSLTFYGDEPKCLVELLREQPSLIELNLGWSSYLSVLLDELTKLYAPGTEKDALLPNLETMEFMGMTNVKWENFADIFSGMSSEGAPELCGEVQLHRLSRPWRSVKVTLIQELDEGAGERGRAPYIPEPVLARLQHVKASGIALELKVASGTESANMKDWIKVSEEWHDIQRESDAASMLFEF